MLCEPRRARAAGDRAVVFSFFWAEGCPHCQRAMPFVRRLEREHHDVRFEWYEVKKSKAGRRRFAREVKRLGIRKPGVPTFICGDEWVMGWTDETERCVRRMLARCRRSSPKSRVDL